MGIIIFTIKRLSMQNIGHVPFYWNLSILCNFLLLLYLSYLILTTLVIENTPLFLITIWWYAGNVLINLCLTAGSIPKSSSNCVFVLLVFLIPVLLHGLPLIGAFSPFELWLTHNAYWAKLCLVKNYF
jgi:hypothetical protein